MNELSYRSWLLKIFQEKSARNSSYNMSAFARDMGLTQARLSEVLNGKQGLSQAVAQNICTKLRLDPAKTKEFCLLVASQHARSKKARELAYKEIIKNKHTATRQLVASEINLLKWYHIACLSLLETTEAKNKFDEQLIARKLGITREQSQECLSILSQHKFIHFENGKYTLKDQRTDSLTFSGVTPQAIKTINLEMMKKAQFALESAPIEERLIGNVIFALNKKDILEFKNLIGDFRRKISSTAEESASKDAVYSFGFQFFELSK